MPAARLRMNRAVLTIALDIVIGIGTTGVFVLVYGTALGSMWPHIFGAEWPALGADPAGSLIRARAIDAMLGAAFGAFLAIAAHRGWLRKPRAGFLGLAAGVLLYAVLDGHGSQSVASAMLETPLPWAVAALIAAHSALGRGPKGMHHEV